jgi:hypothetical protein
VAFHDLASERFVNHGARNVPDEPVRSGPREIDARKTFNVISVYMLSAFKLARIVLACAAVLPIVACDDDLGLDDWSATPDTTTIFSLSRVDLIGRPSAYDFIGHIPVEVESVGATGNWDVALRHEGSQLALVPAGGFEGQTSRAGLALMPNVTFEDLGEAPGDTAAFTREPVMVQEGQVYVVRTRRASCGFTTGVRYGKLKIIAVDPAAGTLRFASLVNPFCNDRNLIPDEIE